MGNRILGRDGNVLRVDFRAPYVAVPGFTPGEIEAARRDEREAREAAEWAKLTARPPPKEGT